MKFLAMEQSQLGFRMDLEEKNYKLIEKKYERSSPLYNHPTNWTEITLSIATGSYF
jgi:hypothetical protein